MLPAFHSPAELGLTLIGQSRLLRRRSTSRRRCASRRSAAARWEGDLAGREKGEKERKKENVRSPSLRENVTPPSDGNGANVEMLLAFS